MSSTHALHPHPTRHQLLKATGVALIAAGLILVTAVLPAEHGIDPTGIGRRLGLQRLSASAEPVVTATLPVSASTSPSPVTGSAPVAGSALRNAFVIQSLTPFRTGEMQVTLGPDQGAEIKAKMHKGNQFTFNWSSSAGAVEFDMHGEAVNAPKDAFTSYWKDETASGAGTFTAPFEGSHGWYWHNHGTQPVTVTVTVSGFYSELYRP
ncbi:hypothetical protein [Tahibacter amnicola]|uniref:Secreted protein n=1 Tax=Tahibacter amnicola TaxID=2976241 RepID=A0ABY6B7H0_9GAMM|nr:hypothetical protein [Tahibacter amnicola]UXI65944.1 hypothetical protein N4264_14390 [Tahibacter amnicola]